MRLSDFFKARPQKSQAGVHRDEEEPPEPTGRPDKEDPLSTIRDQALDSLRTLPESTTSIDLTGLGLSEIPSRVWDFSCLETLILRKNNLTSIPKDIARLVSLRRLEADNNGINSIPHQIGRLPSLEWI